VDELLISAYDFNSQQPRFYSKYFKLHNTGNYDVLLREAMGGSGAAPIYFDPQQLTNKFGIEELVVDGGIICNNPAMYAYLLAKYLKGNQHLRVLSLGTGRDKNHTIKEK
jgi:patatin-like phospholipase/acyl hydrolase